MTSILQRLLPGQIYLLYPLLQCAQGHLRVSPAAKYYWWLMGAGKVGNLLPRSVEREAWKMWSLSALGRVGDVKRWSCWRGISVDPPPRRMKFKRFLLVKIQNSIHYIMLYINPWNWNQEYHCKWPKIAVAGLEGTIGHGSWCFGSRIGLFRKSMSHPLHVLVPRSTNFENQEYHCKWPKIAVACVEGTIGHGSLLFEVWKRRNSWILAKY